MIPTSEQIDALEAMEKAATPPSWTGLAAEVRERIEIPPRIMYRYREGAALHTFFLANLGDFLLPGNANAALIAEARNALPGLIEAAREVIRLRARELRITGALVKAVQEARVDLAAVSPRGVAPEIAVERRCFLETLEALLKGAEDEA